jgi:hypothetical protein
MDQELDTQQPEIEQEQPEEIVAPTLFDDEDQESESQEPAEGAEQPEGESPSLKGQPAPKWVSELRKSHKEIMREKRELQRELEEIRSKLPKQEASAVVTKPTLDQYDYDETRFSEAYDAWMEQKAKLDAADRAKLEAIRKEQEEVENFKKSYAARKQALGVDDFEEAESEVGSILNQTQAGLLMRGADDPAVLVYALSKSPARLIELSKIADPVKFTVAIAKLEISLATKKTTRPAPEARVTAERGATGFNASSSTLQKLRDEAERTGDYSKVAAYKRQIAQK